MNIKYIFTDKSFAASEQQLLVSDELLILDRGFEFHNIRSNRLSLELINFECIWFISYEGTGRSLSLKLINDMRQQSMVGLTAASNFSSKHHQHRKAMPDNGTKVYGNV